MTVVAECLSLNSHILRVPPCKKLQDQEQEVLAGNLTKISLDLNLRNYLHKVCHWR